MFTPGPACPCSGSFSGPLRELTSGARAQHSRPCSAAPTRLARAGHGEFRLSWMPWSGAMALSFDLGKGWALSSVTHHTSHLVGSLGLLASKSHWKAMCLPCRPAAGPSAPHTGQPPTCGTRRCPCSHPERPTSVRGQLHGHHATSASTGTSTRRASQLPWLDSPPPGLHTRGSAWPVCSRTGGRAEPGPARPPRLLTSHA